MDSLTFLSRALKGEPQPVYVLTGDEDFLKRQALLALTRWILGSEDAFGLSSYPGDAAEFPPIRDELATLPFLCPRRLVVVDNADPFVTHYRPQLEKYVAEPATSGVLVLDVKTWPATTRLAKQLTETTILCKAPPPARLPAWCADWARSHHGKTLTTAAAQHLVDLVGAEMGQLDQELAKLAVFVGKEAKIEVDHVDQLVGRSGGANAFRVFDALGAGRPAEALAILDQLFVEGEDPFRLLGAFSLQLRRLAQVARLTGQGASLGEAFDRAGVPAWPQARQSCEQQLRRLGRRKAARLFDWLLEVDLGLKGSSPLPPRTLLERLIVRLANPEVMTKA
jgi:DNA polymerase-3 subunit delta